MAKQYVENKCPVIILIMIVYLQIAVLQVRRLTLACAVGKNGAMFTTHAAGGCCCSEARGFSRVSGRAARVAD